jgi:murein hydrolase activator
LGFTLLPVFLAKGKTALRFAAAQTFVFGIDGYRHACPQCADEPFDGSGLLADGAVKVAGHPNHHHSEPIVFGREPQHLGRDAVNRVSIGHCNGGQRPRERGRRIADGEPDAPTADIQPQYPHRDAIFCRTRMLRRFLAIATAIALAGAALVAQDADRERTETLARRAADRLQALHAEADRLAADERTLLGDVRRLEVDRDIKATELARARADVRGATAELAALDQQAATLSEQATAALPDISARMTHLYKMGRGRYARLLLSASDLRQLGQAVRLVSALAEQDRQRMAQHQRRFDELSAARAAAAERQSKLQQLQAVAEKAEAAAQQALRAHTSLVSEIDTRRDLNARYSGELQAAQQRLQASLSGMSTAAAGTLPMAPFRGDLPWPAPGSVRQRFGSAVAGRPPLRGIEIETGDPTMVHAVHDGTVAYADAFAGYGRLVIVDHGSQTFTLYGNLADISVEKGAKVERGAALGTVGVPGGAGPVLYFELRVDGRAVDPVQWLAKR